MNRALTLAASIAGAVVVALDGTVLTVAQPTLQRDLGASFAQVQWTSTGYLVAVAGLLVFAGRLGDRYGHRRTYAVGMLGFGVASAGVAVAPDVGWVVVLRIVQGVFGALLQPATLGMLRTAFPPDRLRGPIAARTAAIGVAAAAGPLLGGALATGVGWRAVFLVQVPPALLFGALALAAPDRPHGLADGPVAPDGGPSPTAAPVCARPALPAPRPTTARPQRPGHEAAVSSPRRSPDEAAALPTAPVSLSPAVPALRPAAPSTVPPPLDILGALLLGAALACLVHALVGLSGWSLAAAFAVGLAFVRHERRVVWPVVPGDVIGVPAVRAALGVLVAVSAALNGALFACVYVLQRDLGLTPLRCALVGLPLAVLLVAAAPASAVLLRRVGARRTTGAGAAVVAVGVLVLAGAPGVPVFCAGFALVGAGFGTVMVAAGHVVVRQSPVRSAGVAGGLQQTAMNVGPVLGVAVATALMAAGDARSPLPVLALGAAVAVPLTRLLPGLAHTARAGPRDAPHTGLDAETGPSRRSLRHDEV